MKIQITYLMLMTALLPVFAWSAAMEKPKTTSSDAAAQSLTATDAETAVSVDIKLIVGADGTISSIEVLAGDLPDFEQSVQEMVKHWKVETEPGLQTSESTGSTLPVQSYNTPALMAKFWKQ